MTAKFAISRIVEFFSHGDDKEGLSERLMGGEFSASESFRARPVGDYNLLALLAEGFQFEDGDVSAEGVEQLRWWE